MFLKLRKKCSFIEAKIAPTGLSCVMQASTELLDAASKIIYRKIMPHYCLPVINKFEWLKSKRTSDGVFLEGGDAKP